MDTFQNLKKDKERELEPTWDEDEDGDIIMEGADLFGGENVFFSSPGVSIPTTSTMPRTNRFSPSDVAYSLLSFAANEPGIHPRFTNTFSLLLSNTNGVTT